MTVEEASKFFSERQADRSGSRDRRQAAAGNPRASAFSDGRRSGIPDARSDGLDSVRRRSPAHPAGNVAGSRLVGTLYVLDEPSIGLHSRDTHRLIKILHDLRDLGNTILVVEHDPDVMRASDRILDLGPGAGENGGQVIAAGTYDEILKSPDFADRTLPVRRLAHSAASGAPQTRHAADQDLRSAGAQSQEHRFRRSPGNAGRDYRRLRIGQIDSAARRSLPGTCPPPRGKPTEADFLRRLGANSKATISSTTSSWLTSRPSDAPRDPTR